MLKQQIPFIKGSYEEHTAKTLQSPTFLKDMKHVTENRKDYITEE